MRLVAKNFLLLLGLISFRDFGNRLACRDLLVSVLVCSLMAVSSAYAHPRPFTHAAHPRSNGEPIIDDVHVAFNTTQLTQEGFNNDVVNELPNQSDHFNFEDLEFSLDTLERLGEDLDDAANYLSDIGLGNLASQVRSILGLVTGLIAERTEVFGGGEGGESSLSTPAFRELLATGGSKEVCLPRNLNDCFDVNDPACWEVPRPRKSGWGCGGVRMRLSCQPSWHMSPNSFQELRPVLVSK